MADEQYTDLDDKRRRLNAATARGEVMIHDTFIDADGKATDGTSGRLEFAAPAPESLPTPEEIDARDIEAKADPTLAELVRLLRFKGLIGGKQP